MGPVKKLKNFLMFGQIASIVVFTALGISTIILSINTKIFIIFTPACQAHPLPLRLKIY